MISEILMAIEAAFLFLLPLTQTEQATWGSSLLQFSFLFRCLNMWVQYAALQVYFQMVLSLPIGKRRHYIIAKPYGLALSSSWLRMRHNQWWVVMHTMCSPNPSHHHSSLKELLSCCRKSFASKWLLTTVLIVLL